MKILAIETSCDETSLGLVDCKGGLRKPQFKVLENIVSSQIKVHRPFGGVVPSLAKREHIKNLPKLFKKLEMRNEKLKRIDAITVTVGPGLEPALWQGIEFAKSLAKEWKKPLIGANHMEGHLYSNWLPKKEIRNNKLEIRFPAIALVVSGGHTILLKMDSLTKWKKLGETRDDAAGEAFDKVARLLGLPYPGGPEIQKLAVKGNPQAINFPRPMLTTKDYDFSFSGLKTAVLYYLREHPLVASGYTLVADIAASFQQVVIDVLVSKTIRAAKQFKAKSVLLCGGVSANRTLREALKLKTDDLKFDFHVPDFEYNTDNAAMIAAAAYIRYLENKKPRTRTSSVRGRLRLVAQPNLNL